MMWLFCDLREQARGGKIFILWQASCVWSNRKKERKIELKNRCCSDGWKQFVVVEKKEIFDLDSACFFSTTLLSSHHDFVTHKIDITMTWKNDHFVVLACCWLWLWGNFIYENLFCVDVVITLICILIYHKNIHCFNLITKLWFELLNLMCYHLENDYFDLTENLDFF